MYMIRYDSLAYRPNMYFDAYLIRRHFLFKVSSRAHAGFPAMSHGVYICRELGISLWLFMRKIKDPEVKKNILYFLSCQFFINL